MFTIFVAGILLFASTPDSPKSAPSGPDGEGHMNNNLWTVLDSSYGDIGALGAGSASMEFPGGSTDNHLYRGCDWIGVTSALGETLVVANGLC
jgi:hypothetical protein